jgi:CarD family transcriptional regulator
VTELSIRCTAQGLLKVSKRKKSSEKSTATYVLKLAIGDMKVMIPVDNTEEIGLREVISCRSVDKVLKVLKEECTECPATGTAVIEVILKRLKAVTSYEVAGVVRNLSGREKEKGFPPASEKCSTARGKSLCPSLSSQKVGTEICSSSPR